MASTKGSVYPGFGFPVDGLAGYKWGLRQTVSLETITPKGQTGPTRSIHVRFPAPAYLAPRTTGEAPIAAVVGSSAVQYCFRGSAPLRRGAWKVRTSFWERVGTSAEELDGLSGSLPVCGVTR
jgi:hypothetical protein